MNEQKEYHYSNEGTDSKNLSDSYVSEKTASSTPTHVETDFRNPIHSEQMEPLSFSSLTHFPTGVSCMYDIELHKALRSHSDQQCAELSIYDTRGQHFLTKAKRIFVKSEVSSTENIIQEVTTKFHIEEAKVVFHHLEALHEESHNGPFVVILPAARSKDTLILILQCHNFDQHVDDTYFCLRADKKQNVSDLKAMIKTELRWKGLELFLRGYHMNDDISLQDFDLQDFNLMVATKSISKMVTFIYKPTEDIQTHFRIGINTSDSVKIVKQTILNHFEQLQALENKGNSCLHITCGSELLKDHHCFGLTNRCHRQNMYQIHFAPPEAVVCILNYQLGKERFRNFEKATILVSPKCSSSALRNEAAKHMHIDPKAVKLDTETKQRIEEISDVSIINALGSRCTIYAGIKKKKTLLVKHPVSKNPEKVAKLYALEPVSTLRKIIARKYGINELQIVIKHKDITLKDENLLYDYPIKNNVVLDLHLFERRMHIIANVRFKKNKISLIIDDYEKTTIADILKYCAIQLKYRSNCSRCVYAGQCLDTNITVKVAGLELDSEVIIVYFHEEENLQGRLQKFFMVDTDGRVITRYGSVAGGLLLRASKNVQLNPTDEDEKETLPEGISKSASKRQHSINKLQEQKPDQLMMRKDLRFLKRHFIRKARRLIKRKYLVKPIPPDNSRLHDEMGEDQRCMRRMSPTFITQSGDERSDIFDLSIPNINDGDENESNTEISIRSAAPIDEVDEDGIGNWTCDSLVVQPNTYKIKIASESINFCRHDQRNSENERNANELVDVTEGDFGLRQCQVKEDSYLCRSLETVPKAFVVPATITEDPLCRDTNHDVLKPLLDNSGASSDSGYRVEIDENSKWQISRQMMQGTERRRTETEPPGLSSMALERRLTVNHNLPTNISLTTAGITVPLLHFISSGIGTHWKKLARRLNIAETELDELEHMKYSLYEKTFQCIRLWKIRGGGGATKECLVNALRDIEMLSVAEACEQFAVSGYHTA